MNCLSRVAIIRLWMLAIFTVVVSAIWPQVGIAFWPILFLFPICVCCAQCTRCNTGTTPQEFQITIAGLGAPLPCCAGLNGTYIVTLTGVSASSCNWTYTISPKVCDGSIPGDGYYRVQLTLETLFGVSILRVSIYNSGFFGADAVTWEKTISFPTDCNTINTSVPAASGGSCNNSGTCQVLAL